MVEESATAPALLNDEIQVRAFMLADHVVREDNGKIYMNGGAIEWIGVNDPVERLPQLFMLIRLSFPWRLTSGGHVITVRVLDPDRNPVGADPAFTATAQIGRPPGAQPGDEFCINVVAPLTGFPISAPPDSTIMFNLSVNDQEIATLPLKLRRIVSVRGIAR